jgi:hypothetical protein
MVSQSAYPEQNSGRFFRIEVASQCPLLERFANLLKTSLGSFEFRCRADDTTAARKSTDPACELNTVQSNVTNRIRALETEIGTPLFESHARGMTLTDAGADADRLNALSNEALAAARDDGVAKGPLAIGAM